MTTASSKMLRRLVAAVVLCAGAGAAVPVRAHCQIPCGIYGDKTRVELLREHAETIEKSMKQVVELSQADPTDHNQLVRWVTNKEEHANKVQEIVYQYFMSQRVKPVSKGQPGHDQYVNQITLLHRMLVSSMKCKQSTDATHVEQLRQAIDQFEKAYFHKH